MKKNEAEEQKDDQDKPISPSPVPGKDSKVDPKAAAAAVNASKSKEPVKQAPVKGQI